MTAGSSAVSARGTVSFRPDALELEAGGRLTGSRCPACGAIYFPPRQLCSRCLADELEPAPLSTGGVVHSYTVVHQATPEFEVPYVLAYVDLPEGVRVLGQVAGLAPEEARIGMPVELELQSLGEDDTGQETVGYRFRPAAGEEQ